PVKGNFASLLMKVSEQESGFQEQPEPVAQPVTMQSAAAPVDEPIPVPPAEPAAVSTAESEQGKRRNRDRQEMLFPFAEPAGLKNVKTRKRAMTIETDNEKDEAAPRKMHVPAAGLLILIVDDSEANCEIMDHMLEFRGYRPDQASSGEQALDLCASKPYDLIFMDCFMPGLDGYRTTQMIRSRFPDLRKKIIGMSARLGEQELQRCIDAGMNDLLAKPFTLKELDAIIEKHCV
ncbi:MAG: response regulator, partial [Spirochaetaceae bacterium]|nr:response regulator [Spirochaetaceae bacterium]